MTSVYLMNAAPNELSPIQEKNEVIELKKELTNFYNKKEAEYVKRKKELDTIAKNIANEKKQISDLYEKNQEILKDIQGQVASKTAKIYNKMKAKDLAPIFNQMINEGKIEDVFDIILKLKESNVTSLLKFLSVENASLITEKLKNYNSTK